MAQSGEQWRREGEGQGVVQGRLGRESSFPLTGVLSTNNANYMKNVRNFKGRHKKKGGLWKKS